LYFFSLGLDCLLPFSYYSARLHFCRRYQVVLRQGFDYHAFFSVTEFISRGERGDFEPLMAYTPFKPYISTFPLSCQRDDTFLGMRDYLTLVGIVLLVGADKGSEDVANIPRLLCALHSRGRCFGTYRDHRQLPGPSGDATPTLRVSVTVSVPSSRIGDRPGWVSRLSRPRPIRSPGSQQAARDKGLRPQRSFACGCRPAR